MIIDKVQNAGQYKGISPWLDTAIDCMLQTDFGGREAGRYEVDGKNVFFMVQEPVLRAREDTKWEIHRRYIDIQMGLVEGESIGYAPADGIGGWEAYNEEKDIAISYEKTPGAVCPLGKDTFMILFPQDAHRPCERAKDVSAGRKVVFKVRV